MEYKERLARLRRSLAARKLDAMLVGRPENRRYLSGYTADDHGIGETAGLLLVVRQGPSSLLTDFRFQEQAEAEATDFEVQLYPDGLFALLKKLLPRLKIKRLAFESDYTLHSTAKRLDDLASWLNCEAVPVKGIVENMRLLKSETEIERIRRSVRLNEEVFRHAYAALDAGKSEIDVALEIELTMKQRGAEKESFDTIVASGAFSSLPHASPRREKLAANGPLVIDMGLVLEGYCSDMTRSFRLGPNDEFYTKIHRIVRRAQLAGMEAVRAGARCRDVDRAARRVIEDAGYGQYFGHALGHGVGLAVHEEPRISPKSRKTLKPGMVITIEPGIYIPDWGGIRLENMVVVREDGYENLNTDTTRLDL